MDTVPPRKRMLARKPGLRALEACGDGFWELDLMDGSAWYSEWFYQKLNWPTEIKRTRLADLEPLFKPDVWRLMMRAIRAHLEQSRPLDLEFDVQAKGEATRRWRILGSSRRNDAGQPIYLAGSMRDMSAEGRSSDAPSGRSRLSSAFEALPVAAALLDGRATVLEANHEWHSLPEATIGQAVARLRAANSHTGIEFWLDQGEGFDAGPRRLRVRAVAFQHDGARHLAVTIEDRRSD